jgi:hypothetical protein
MAQERHKLETGLVTGVAASQGIALSSAEAAAGIAAALGASGTAAARAMTDTFEAEPSGYVVAQLALRGRS